jgi:hypothetical protein
MTEILALVDQGSIRAMRIGSSVRIPETEPERLLVTCAASHSQSTPESLPGGSRGCLTRTGTKFRVSGSIADGAEIWPGKMRYPIKFPRSFMKALLSRFSEPGDVAVGGSFDGPSPGSLGEFIQQKLNTKMNPAVYIAALLINEGYADASARRGYIEFRHPAWYAKELPDMIEPSVR